LSGPRIQPALTASVRTPEAAETTSLDPVGDPPSQMDLPPETDARASDPRHAADPASGNRLGVVRGIIIGLAISGLMWAGIVALVLMVL